MVLDAGPESPAEPPAGSGESSPGEVRAQLARIVASPGFDAPERSRGFLRHVVEETLAGRGGRIERCDRSRRRALRATAGVGRRSRPTTRTPSVRAGVSAAPAA